MYERYSFDAEYVRLLEDGDPATEVHFFQYFRPLIRIKTRVRLRGGADLEEDVCQETLLRVIRSVRQGRVSKPERFGAYVSGVCMNVILEHARRGSRYSQFSEDQPEIPSRDPGAESLLFRNERIARVREAMEELSSRDQELLRRIFLQEDDPDDVCQEFDITREYLRVLLHRARSRLKTAVNQRDDGD